jgi:hypothetical protein
LAAVTRPDLVIFVGLLSLSTPAIRRRLPTVVLAAAVVSVPWLVWSWLYFGSAIPDTFVLKTLQHSFRNYTFTNGPLLMLHKYAAATVLSFAAALLGSVVLLERVVRRFRVRGAADRRFDPVLAFGVGGIAYYVAYSALGVPPYQWYYSPAIAALSVFVAMLLPHVLARAAGAGSARRPLVVIGPALLAMTVLAEAVVVVGHDLPWRESVIMSNWATAAQYARIGRSLRARVGDQAVKSPGEIGTLAFFCQCAIVDHYSDRGWVIPEVEKRIAQAGPVARFLLRLNYRHLDRDLLPRPPEYTLVWARGHSDDPDTWEVSSSETGPGHLRLVHQDFDSTAIEPLARDVIAALPPGRGPVVLGVSNPFHLYYQFRLARELERRHVSVRLDPEPESPRRRTYDGHPARTRLTVSSGYDTNHLVSAPDQIVAYVGTVSRARRVEIARQGRELEAMHRAHELTDREYFFQAGALLNLGTDLAVIAVDSP